LRRAIQRKQVVFVKESLNNVIEKAFLTLQEIRDLLIQQNLLLKKQILLRKRVLTFEEGCDFLGIASSYGYKLSSQKILPTYCPTGKRIWFLKSELENWCLQNRQATEAELEQQSINYLTKKPLNSLKHVS